MNSAGSTQTYSVGVPDFAGRRHYRIRDEDWRPLQIGGTDIPGYFWIPLSDDEEGGWSSYWMKVEPGACGPEHRHDTTELIFVAEGVFTDSDGVSFLAGDVVTYPAGSSHSSSSASGCIVLVVARAGMTV